MRAVRIAISQPWDTTFQWAQPGSPVFSPSDDSNLPAAPRRAEITPSMA